MRKILIISYFFPPVGGGGVIRVTKFVKYLPQFGWKPYILTVKKGFYPIEDKSLLGEIPKEAEVLRINYFEPALWLTPAPKSFGVRAWQSLLAYLIYPLFLIPDRQILWFLPAVVAARKIIKKEKIKVIFTTSAPATDHLIGLILKKITHVKWVADFRDEWTNNPLKKYPTPIHRFFNQFLEKKVIKNADQVITVSEPITEYLKNLSIDKKKFSTITNGFDETDFQGLNPEKSKIFRLVHSGSLYDLKYQKSFTQAFRSLNLKNARLTFVGDKVRLSHKMAIKKMVDADVLLLILDPIERPGVLTGKLFEYLRAGKPILALTYQNSEAAKMITKYQIGEVVNPNPQAFQRAVAKMYQKWQKNDLNIPQVNLGKYERKNLTGILAKNFDKLIKNPHFAEASWGRHKIKLCLIGNLQSSQNQSLCKYFAGQNYDVHFITTKPAKMNKVITYYLGRNSFTPWYFLKSAYKTKRIIQKIEPDIVHGQDLVFGGIWAYLSGFRPFVVTCWGSDIFNYQKFIPIEKNLIRKTLANASLVTGTSEAIGQEAERINILGKRWQLVHFGIDLKIFSAKRGSAFSGKKTAPPAGGWRSRVIFCPRAIGQIYNIDILIKAFLQVAKKRKDVKLALLENATDKNYLLEIEKLIIKYDLVDRVLFWPKVVNQKMAAYYNKAEVIVSISSSDGCSVSFLEAMACEKKIVATDLPYIKEWNMDGNLWTVPVRDAGFTSKAILSALKYPNSKWQKIGKKNRKLIAQKAEINSNFEKLDRMYQSLI